MAVQGGISFSCFFSLFFAKYTDRHTDTTANTDDNVDLGSSIRASFVYHTSKSKVDNGIGCYMELLKV